MTKNKYKIKLIKNESTKYLLADSMKDVKMYASNWSQLGWEPIKAINIKTKKEKNLWRLYSKKQEEALFL